MGFIVGVLTGLATAIGGMAFAVVLRILSVVAAILAALVGGWAASRVAAMGEWRPGIRDSLAREAFMRLRGLDRAQAEAALWTDHLGEVFVNGAIVAFLAMLAVGLASLAFERRYLAAAWLSLAASLLVAALVAANGGFAPGRPWWPTVVAPLVAAPVGLGAWRLLDALSHAVGTALDLEPGSVAPDIDPSP